LSFNNKSSIINQKGGPPHPVSRLFYGYSSNAYHGCCEKLLRHHQKLFFILAIVIIKKPAPGKKQVVYSFLFTK
jgi:hypothetical protein